MPETLKSLDELLLPDSRSEMALVNRKTGEARPLTLEDYHRYATTIRLNETVPEPIRDHFTTALHLGVYSWLVYRFTMVSQQQAYATLEWALRERVGALVKKSRPMLADLLKTALDKGFLRGRLFQQWARIGGDPADEAAADAWLRDVAEMILHFRNHLSHGSWHLVSMHWDVLRIVADAVNQLYPEDAKQNSE
jgi:hypothetical protein